MKDLLNIEILTATFDDLPSGVGIFRVDDLDDLKSIRYVFMNKMVLYEMKKEKEEVFGKRIIEVAPEAYEHEGGLSVIETYFKVAREGKSINLGLVPYSNHMVKGTSECSVHHIKENYVYVILRNVTELEQTKNELELINEDLKQFTYQVSHDLREPLRTISNLVRIIKDRYHTKLDEKANKYLNFIYESSGRMKNLITDLLDYSSIGEGKEKTLVDMEKLVEIVQADLGSLVEENNATIEVNDLPKVKGFQTELRLLFQNLISNGIKFSKPGVPPKIIISAEEQEEWVFIIQDNGIGIAKEDQDKIFAAFQRVHSRNEYEGTGLGLAHCKKIVDLHKGRLWVHSTQGEGSTFSFTIPK